MDTAGSKCKPLPVVHVESPALQASQTSAWLQQYSDAGDFRTGTQMPLSPLTAHGQAQQPSQGIHMLCPPTQNIVNS